jgi:hypothetical protein
MIHTDCLIELGVFRNFELHFRNHVNCIFLQCIFIVYSVTLPISSLECTLCTLYFTLVRSKLDYASVVPNSITSTGANILERTQQKFAALCFNHVFVYIHYGYAYALEELHCTSYRRKGATSMHYFVLNCTLVLLSFSFGIYLTLSSRLVYQRLSESAPQIKVVFLIDALQLLIVVFRDFSVLELKVFLLYVLYSVTFLLFKARNCTQGNCIFTA